MNDSLMIPEIYNLSMKEKNFIIEQFVNAVVSTMGPGGHTVILNKTTDGIPHVTKDGVSVAEAINTAHPVVNAIISLIKESSRKTARLVGDGTTTSTLLAMQFCKMAEEMIEKNGVTSREYFNIVEDFVGFVWEQIRQIKIEIEDPKSELLNSIVNISCNSDSYLTSLIKKATELAGKDGSIQVEIADSKESFVTSTNGALLETKTDVREKTVLENAFLLIVEGKINDGFELFDVIHFANQNNKPIVIIAQEFNDKVKRVAQINRGRGIPIFLVEAEGFADSRLEILRDLSNVTGQPIYSTAGGTDLPLNKFVEFNEIMPKIILTKRDAVITPNDEESDWSDIIEEIKNKMINADDHTKRFLQMRLNKYAKTAIIHVGGSTEAEANERKDRIDDAIAAVESAFNHGILPGGGAALIKLESLVIKKFTKKLNGDKNLDAWLKQFSELCWIPLITITKNAGFGDIYKVLQDSEEFKNNPNITFDSISGKLVDCYEKGIVDPAEVLSTALLNASAVAKTVMNSKYQLTGIKWPSEEK